MAWLGMNDDEVAKQGTVLQQQAQAIDALMKKVDTEIANLKKNWQGPDSQKFEGEWTKTHRNELMQAKKLLEDMKHKIDQEVKQQQSTSNAL